MRFQRLEMQGFKSFVEKTVIEIGEGLTAVVGPNGCGKSNVCDAVRWVLGEQAPKNMRSKKMEDVIFNGSAERRQLGMSEVSLTVTDLQGVVTSPAFKDFDEVVVTRRLYRSGESEYLINRTPCRLKDIVDLFLDTGVSLDTFSIVEQGKIETLVNARPMDRRVLIEEAAGIMKYKSRRNEALRKLELAQANLLRVADIMREKESRLRSLRRQARKATFHKEYQTEVADLSRRIMVLDYLKHLDKLVPAEKAYDRVKEEEQAVSAKLSSLEAERESGRISLSERTEALVESRQRATRVEGSLERLETRVEMLKSHLAELDVDDARRAEEMQTLDAEITTFENERGELASALEALTEQSGLARREYDVGAAELAAVRENLKEFERALDAARRAQEEERERLSAARQQIASVESRREGLAESMEKTGNEIREVERQLESTRTDAGGARSRLESLVASEGEAKRELEGAISECARVSGSSARHEESVAGAKESLMEAKSALAALEGVLGAGESGISDAEAFRSCGAQVLASFSEVIRVDSRFEKAIETALGDRLLGVVVDTPGDAVDAIRALMGSEAGRGVALPVEVNAPPGAVVPLGEGVLGAATDFVRCDMRYRHLVRSLLGNVVVVEDVDAAQAAWCNGPQGVVCVTLNGEIIHANGVVEGGLTRNEGFLERSRRCEEMRLEVERLEAQLRELEPVSRELSGQLAKAEEGNRRAAEAYRRAEVMRVEAEGALRAAEGRREELETRLAALEAAQEQIRGEGVRLAEALQTVRDESLGLEETIQEFTLRIREIEKKVSGAGLRCAEVEARVTDRKVALTEIDGQVAGRRAEVQRVVDGISQNSVRKNRREEEQRESREKRERLTEGIAQSGEGIRALQDEKADVAAELAERDRVLGEMQSRDEELADSIRDVKARASVLNDEVRAAADRRTTLRVQRESMEETAEAEYQLNLEETAESRREELPQYQEILNRLEMLNKRLSKMGEVNPLAAQEYDEINQEYVFLQEQQQDLESSIADLHATIEKLNKTTKSRFLAAFEEVGSAFSDIFGRLFQGGEARMFLLDPDDPLETGVDIEVRPPGKRPSNIMLLSAGEKALTAISLLFAVFSVRPSPFCILDEVDATLDDANVGRFREVLAELEDRSQFIIITHNKKTMSFANHLYGVTQREKGVSEIVSVKLSREDERVNGVGEAVLETTV
ncbi:MAG: chromosome segregation protein SMC [Nitrospinae bacterium]|nr:chromosome segregation protein SMC [Nitrospinota bacterium]